MSICRIFLEEFLLVRKACFIFRKLFFIVVIFWFVFYNWVNRVYLVYVRDLYVREKKGVKEG